MIEIDVMLTKQWCVCGEKWVFKSTLWKMKEVQFLVSHVQNCAYLSSMGKKFYRPLAIKHENYDKIMERSHIIAMQPEKSIVFWPLEPTNITK